MLGWGCCPLACRHGHVCVRRVVICLVILCMFMCCLEPMGGVIVTCCMDCMLAFIVNAVIKLLLSSPYFLLTPGKKKMKTKKHCFTCCCNDGVITYDIRASSTHDQGSLQLSLI
jgi:hypothetical protein